MSRRANTSNKASSSKRLERRAERQAKQPGAAAPRPARARASATRTQVKSRGINPWIIVGVAGGIAIIGLLVYAVVGQGSSTDGLTGWQKAEQDASTSLPGVYYPVHPGFDGRYGTADDRQHFANGITYPLCSADQIANNEISNPLCYTSNPPVSGPHAVSPMPFKVLDNPAPKENLIHDMEHGGVVIWYNTSNQDVINQLKDITNSALDRRRLVVMSEYKDMEADTIAVTAWTRIDKFSASQMDRKRVQDFIEAHNKRFNPEGF